MVDILIAVLIGLTAGFASGVAGIGGGVIMVPGLVFILQTPQHLAQGTSLLAIIFTAMSGTRINLRHERVDLRSAITIGAIGAVTAFLAARLANQMDADLLRQLFGGLLIFSGSRMALRTWRDRTKRQAD